MTFWVTTVITPLSFLKILIGSLCPILIMEEEFITLVYPLNQKLEDILVKSGYFQILGIKPDIGNFIY
jgi:hypothetical protein